MAGIAVTFCGLLLASQLGSDPSTLFVVVALMTIGLGGSLFNPANARVIYAGVARNALGTASAISTSGRYIGQSLGAGLGALLLATDADGDIANAFSLSMLILAGLILGGMVLIWTSGRFIPASAQPKLADQPT
jgi:MFS family permease